MTRPRTTLLSLALVALSSLALGACGTRSVRGVVLEAPISRSVIVDARDERLTQQGVPGVEVKLLPRGKENSGGVAVIAKGVSDETGAFDIRIPANVRLRGPVVVLADGDNVFRSTTQVYLPNEGQQLVVNVRTNGATAAVDADEGP